MRILCACEESQAVCKEFRALGHIAYSCDILPCSGGFDDWHLQADVRQIVKLDWDMIIAFPPCTNLSVSGARWFREKIASGEQQKAIDFFMLFAESKCKRVCIENPIGIMSTHWRKPDQIIQPWMFGHAESKATCLWLKELPKLVEEDNVKAAFDSLPIKEKNRIHYMPPGKDRGKMRSKTFEGIAKAMAKQWGEL